MKQATDQPIFVGVMTGTSIDGLDIAAIRLRPNDSSNRNMNLPGKAASSLANKSARGAADQIDFVAAAEYPLPADLRRQIRQLARNSNLDWQTFGQVDAALGELTGRLVNQFLNDFNIPKAAVRAIGSHGQTVHHSPDSRPAFTVQLGDASRICEETGLTVVSDFRRADIAAGGQGAPLVPAFHAALFGSDKEGLARAVCNIGGIANITLLPAHTAESITGFDTGPGNTLLDAWCQKHKDLPFDADGSWAAEGTCSATLLSALLGDPYVQRPPPKSTGVEHYNLQWLEPLVDTARKQSMTSEITATDVQATLLEFTARTIISSVRASQPDCTQLIVCGGGRRNSRLMNELAQRSSWPVVDCDTFAPGRGAAEGSIDGDALEAAAFAWLACQNLAGLPGNIPTVTGARKPVLLGCVTRSL